MSRILKNKDNKVTYAYGNGHVGIDIISATGGETTVLSHTKGKVIAVVDDKDKDNNTKGVATYGNYVQIEHENGYSTLYAHLRKGVKVKKGDYLPKGTELGIMGESGNAYGEHLHFEVRKNNYVTDPTKYLEDDLPNQSEDFGFKLMYRVHLVDGEWLDWVEASDNETPKYNEYAGLYGKPIDGVQIKLIK